MELDGHEEQIQLAVTLLASSNIFLGHDWLSKHNLEIDWKLGRIKFTRCPDACSILVSQIDDKVYARRTTINKIWPDYLDEFANVFSEKEFDQLPEHHTWDHIIDLKPDFKLSDCKVYPLSLMEQESMKSFILEQLISG